MDIKEISSVVLAILVLSLISSFQKFHVFYKTLIIFAIIIIFNIMAKKVAGYFLEIDVKTKLWSFYQFGLRRDSHFKNPIPMIWLPIVLVLLTKGLFWWLAVLDFDAKPRIERVAKRHGTYRFAKVTEWHLAWIAIWGIFANLILAIAGYFAGFPTFTKFNLYFAFWSIIPFSTLDGSKIFFSSRGLWIFITSIIIILFAAMI